MKKQLFVLAFFLLPLCLMAQEESNKFQLGFTGSPNIGWLQVTNDGTSNMTSENPKVGFSYGVLGDIGFARNYYFSTAFVVTTINGNSSVSNINTGPGTGNIDYTWKIRYIEVPLTLKLKSNDNNGIKYYGQFGLGTGVKISARQDFITRNASGTPFGDNLNISDNVNTLRLSLVAGGGTEWQVGPDLRVLTGLTLNNGFTNTLDGSDQLRNSYLALTLGIFF